MSQAREVINIADAAKFYFREMMKLCGPGVGRNSFDENPALRNMRSYSDIGYESPARVPASMIKLNPAAVRGRHAILVRHEFHGHRPAVRRKRRVHFSHQLFDRGRIEVMQKTGDQDEIVARSKIHFESVSRNRVVARVNLCRPRIFLSPLPAQPANRPRIFPRADCAARSQRRTRRAPLRYRALSASLPHPR